MLKKIQETVDFIKSKNITTPEIGIILGTGLGGLTKEINSSISIPYNEIPNFPVSTVKGHHGQLIFGTLSGKPVVAMKGRFHYYEGYSLQKVTFPIRIMKYLGVRLLILSNASGGLNPAFEKGDMMFVEDHINLMNSNPLIGPNHDGMGPRFPDMSEPYDKSLLKKASEIASGLGISHRTGVYAGVTGPTFETPAEYRYIRYIGADAVGMSTVPETIIANHMGLRVFAISVISDLGVNGKIEEITHEMVIDVASHVEPELTRIIKALLPEI